MSQFDRYTQTEYVEALRSFLGLNKRNFLREFGFISDTEAPRRGRIGKYPEEAVKRLEALANERAARCEATDSSVAERLGIARDYLGLTDADLARHVGVSREMVRRWREGTNPPSKMQALAEVLQVPQAWLENGGEDTLPANSHLGVRVGDEANLWREEVYGLTLQVVGELEESADEDYIRAYLEWAVHNKPALSRAARRAGGRWQVVNGALLFAPWVPIEEHGLTRRYWSDEVEAIIEEELGRQPSVYRAWEELRRRCEEMGLSEEDYPARISLHKRIEKEKARAEKFGVDLNDLVAASVQKCTKQ